MRICIGFSLVIFCAVFQVFLLSPVRSLKNHPNKTTRDGVYNTAQANRGERVYRDRCISCHNSMSKGARLSGTKFFAEWDGTSLDSLFQQIQRNMPGDAPASLSDSEYLDLIAYLLRMNKLPASTSSNFPMTNRELIRGQLPGIQFAGYRVIERNGTLVQIVGCLGQRTATS